MKRRKQKGFTILELVIVIAIIGVLTGIMIPVISNIVSKANEANDVTLARNISTSLKISSKPISSLNDIKDVVEEQYGEDSFANLTPRSASKGNHFWYNYEQGIVEVKTFDEIKEREDYRQFDGSFRSCIKEGYVFLDQQGSELASIATLLESIYSRRECDQLLEYFASQNDIASNFLTNLNNTLIINENGCLRGSNYNEISNVYFTSDNVRLTKTTLFEFSENKIAFKTIDEESPLGGSGLNNKVINIKKTMFFGTDTLIFASTSLPILSVDVNNITQLADIFSSNSTNALIRINNDNNLYRIVDKTIVNSSNNQVVYSGLTGTISDSVRNYQLPELYEATISKEVSTSNNTVTNSVNIENENVNATIPSGVKVTNNTLELTVTPKEASEANVVLGENTHIVTVNYANSTKRFLVKDGDTITLENLQMPNHAYKWSDGTNFYEEGSVYTVNGDVTLSVALRVALNPTNGWTIDNAKFAIYALAPGDANAMWIRMALNETLNIYEAYVPVTNMAKILFARVNPAAFDGTLEFKEGVVWNQTHDITDAASKHYYTYEIGNQSDGKYEGTWKNNSCVFLNPNIWNAADATERYSVYYFTNNVRSTWCDMEYDSTLDKYVCFIPNGYANLIFVRMNGNTTENNWDNDWNQTIDLGVDGNQGKTYTITGFTGWGNNEDKSSGNWDS